jgi:large subunit ribosomal protein L10
LNRTEKGQVVSALHKTLSGTTLVVVTKQVGLTVAEVSNLRRKMRAA